VQGLGPRFALEAVFLIALAVGAGLAELSAAAIVVVMALAWLLICLFELAVWLGRPRLQTLERRTVVEEEAEPAAVTEIREPETPKRRRFWRRRRQVSGEGA
jgi:uncharacterized membrane protein YhiD involved in acid resistance